MAKLLKLRRGTTTQHGSFIGAEGEVTIDTDKDTAVVHDGSTTGGRALAREDLNNVSSSTIAGRLSNDSIAVSKIAAGTLPSDVKIQDANVSGNLTIESADIVNGTIVNADINASAAIAGTKVSPDFGSQNVVTTGTLGSGNFTITDSVPVLAFVDSNDNSDFRFKLNGGTLQLEDTTNGNADRLTIASDGTVGINGNLDVGAGLDVTGNITATGSVTVDQGAIIKGANDTAGILELHSDRGDDNADKWRFIAEATGSELNLQNYANGAWQNNFRSTGNAGVDLYHSNGIKASTTGSGFNVSGNITVTGTVDGRDVASDGSKLDGIESGATADQTASEIASALNGQNIYTTGHIGRDNNDYFTFNNNANVDLNIAGSTEFRFESDGDFHADGDVIAQSTSISSDRRLKDNIEVIPNALDKVQALNGVSFDWKKTGERSAGVIAQEVQEVLPEAVKEVVSLGGEGESHLTVNYHALTSILIESIKELKAEIEELKGGA